MSKLINEIEIKQLYNEFIRELETKTPRKQSFESFLEFLEIDFYDWVRGNLKNYFREVILESTPDENAKSDSTRKIKWQKYK